MVSGFTGIIVSIQGSGFRDQRLRLAYKLQGGVFHAFPSYPKS